MESLVFKSNKGNPVTNSLLVAAKFDKQHRNVLESIRNLIRTAKFLAVGTMFYETIYLNEQNKEQPMFIMNRDGFTLLAMRYTGTKALTFQIEYIAAFNKMEKAIKLLAIPNFNNPVEAARAWADEKEKNELAKSQIKALAPKADFADRVIDSEDNHLVDIGQAAKLLKIGIGRNTFFIRLKEDGVFFKNRNEPKQQYINQGYFDLREVIIPRKNHPSTIKTKVLVTQKGLFWLSKKYGGEFKPGIPLLKVE